MDRRKFLSGIGTVSTMGAVGTGLAVRESTQTKARIDGLAEAAGASPNAKASQSPQTRKLLIDGLMLGYLPGSAGMFATPTIERAMRTTAAGLRWSPWDASLATRANQSAVHSLFKVSSLVDVSIGVLRPAGDAAGALRALDITAHFAFDETPYFAPFTAWSFQAAGLSAPQKSTQPLTFSARTPDQVALEIKYALQPSAATSALSTAGTLYLPIGPSSATTGGLATGLYVLATPSASTGVQPDLSAYVFTGNVHAPIGDASGRALDFDYLAFAIRPGAV